MSTTKTEAETKPVMFEIWSGTRLIGVTADRDLAAQEQAAGRTVRPEVTK